MSENEATTISNGALWTGRVVSVISALLLITSATLKLIKPEGTEKSLEPIGWSINQLTGLGILEASVAIIYLIPQTRILGAILVTGYIGGAIATHVRIGDYFVIPQVLLGVLVWFGVWIRDPRLKRLIPFN